MSKNTENSMMIKEFLTDRKAEAKVKGIINGREADNSFSLLMRFFAADKSRFSDGKDLEAKQYNQATYNALDWSDEKNFDVINSFWTVFKCSLIELVQRKYEVKPWAKCYYFTPDGLPLVPGGKDTHKYKNDNNKDVLGFPVRYLTYNRGAELVKLVDTLQIERPDIVTLANICHSVANFMPCPAGFNGSKYSAQIDQNGKKLRTFDFLPLMIDLIEQCCTEQMSMLNGPKLETIKVWKDWFISNREKYCLEDYYYIFTDSDNVKHIKGIPLFEKQSLEYPLPKETREVTQCLDEMVKRIKIRAYRLYEQQQIRK